MVCCLPTNPVKLKKRIGLCIKVFIGVLVLGILILIAGVVLTALFSKHLDDDQHKSEKVLAVVGIALLVLGLIVVIISVALLVFIYRKLKKAGSRLRSELFGKGKGPDLPI